LLTALTVLTGPSNQFSLNAPASAGTKVHFVAVQRVSGDLRGRLLVA
jgi:hypothetical protein